MAIIWVFSLPLLLFHFLMQVSINAEPGKLKPLKKSISAVLVFGDSTVDSGNNNYLYTAFKSNFPPYGRDFTGRIPTGRFSDGRLVTDFIASYAGIKEYVPPYLDPKLSLDDLMTGVCFASAGTGFDPLTAQITGVIPIQKQLEYFKEYKSKLEVGIGRERTKTLISNAAFLISAGTNDIVFNYLGTPFRRATYDITAYQQLLMQFVQQFIRGLMEEGGRVIGLVGLPPIGCLPIVITFASSGASCQRRCNDALSSIALDFNQKLQNTLTAAMQNSNSTIYYVDIYQPLKDMIQNPSQFGFDNVNAGCCGSGLVEAAYFCNSKSIICENPSKYVFFDSIHPTEATYNYIFKALRPTIDRVIFN